MPAIHVDDLTVLPRVATSTKQPRGHVHHHRTSWFRRRGFPVRRAFAGVPWN